MPGDFGEFTVNIGLGINFLAGGTLSLNSNDTLSYIHFFQSIQFLWTAFFLCSNTGERKKDSTSPCTGLYKAFVFSSQLLFVG